MNEAREQTKEKSTFRMEDFLRKNFVFIGLILITLLFEVLTGGRLLGQRNLMNIFNNFFTIGLCAMAYTFIISLGEADLSTGAVVGISAAMGAFASEIGEWAILPAAILTGVLIGMLNGVMIAKLRVMSFIGTLASSFVFRGLTTYLLNGSRGIPISMRAFDANGVKILTFVVFALLFYILFEHCVFGKHARAVGSSAEAARQSGVRVTLTRFLSFTVVGLMSGLVGFFTLVRACTASVGTGSAFEFDVLLAVLFGGMPLSGGWSVRFRTTVIGAVTMAMLKSGMSLMGINGLTQQVVEGALLIMVVCITFDRKMVAVIR